MTKFYILVNGIACDCYEDYMQAYEVWLDSLDAYENVKLVLEIADSGDVRRDKAAYRTLPTTTKDGVKR